MRFDDLLKSIEEFNRRDKKIMSTSNDSNGLITFCIKTFLHLYSMWNYSFINMYSFGTGNFSSL